MWAVVSSFFEGTAYAHGTPVNGLAYLLTFSTSKNAKLVRVFTTKTSYQPSADAWNKLTMSIAAASTWKKAKRWWHNYWPTAI